MGMRILNIVTPKCKILASRERCPFLVCCEISETGLYSGSDARLYAGSGAGGVGATLEEAMGMATAGGNNLNNMDGGFAPYHIPPELFVTKEEQIVDKLMKLNGRVEMGD